MGLHAPLHRTRQPSRDTRPHEMARMHDIRQRKSAAFKAFVQASFAYLNRHPDVPRFVTIACFNEWSEGHYLLPTTASDTVCLMPWVKPSDCKTESKKRKIIRNDEENNAVDLRRTAGRSCLYDRSGTGGARPERRPDGRGTNSQAGQLLGLQLRASRLPTDTCWMQVDLGRSYPIDQVNSIRLSGTGGSPCGVPGFRCASNSKPPTTKPSSPPPDLRSNSKGL